MSSPPAKTPFCTYIYPVHAIQNLTQHTVERLTMMTQLRSCHPQDNVHEACDHQQLRHLVAQPKKHLLNVDPHYLPAGVLAVFTSAVNKLLSNPPTARTTTETATAVALPEPASIVPTTPNPVAKPSMTTLHFTKKAPITEHPFSTRARPYKQPRPQLHTTPTTKPPQPQSSAPTEGPKPYRKRTLR
jgi:hypothetical protein